MVIIVIVSKSHPTLVLFEYKPSRLGGTRLHASGILLSEINFFI